MSYLYDIVQKAKDEAMYSLFNNDMTNEQKHFLIDKAIRLSSEYGIYIGLTKKNLGYDVKEELDICKETMRKYLIANNRSELNKVK